VEHNWPGKGFAVAILRRPVVYTRWRALRSHWHASTIPDHVSKSRCLRVLPTFLNQRPPRNRFDASSMYFAPIWSPCRFYLSRIAHTLVCANGTHSDRLPQRKLNHDALTLWGADATRVCSQGSAGAGNRVPERVGFALLSKLSGASCTHWWHSPMLDWLRNCGQWQ